MMPRKRIPSGDSPSASPRSSSLNEMIEVRGVRISCETTARNCARSLSGARVLALIAHPV